MKKQRLRLGTTSYITPADIVTNVRRLSGRVRDIELVFFESDAISNLPTHEEIALLNELALAGDFSYTVHLPLDIELGAFDEEVRQESVGKCLRTLERAADLKPFSYVVHFNGDQRGGGASRDPQRWLSALERSVGEIIQSGVIASRDLCVETLDYPFELVAPLLTSAELSVCLDVGHIFLYGMNLSQYLERYLDRCRILHLHGITDGRDHRALDGLEAHQIDSLRRLFNKLVTEMTERVVTLEVFSEEDLDRSLCVVRELVDRSTMDALLDQGATGTC